MMAILMAAVEITIVARANPTSRVDAEELGGVLTEKPAELCDRRARVAPGAARRRLDS
jgi:hypothetical protein